MSLLQGVEDASDIDDFIDNNDDIEEPVSEDDFEDIDISEEIEEDPLLDGINEDRGMATMKKTLVDIDQYRSNIKKVKKLKVVGKVIQVVGLVIEAQARGCSGGVV